jgi:hypothetical protein
VEGYDEIRVQVDRCGVVIGLTVIHDVGGLKERIRPLEPGPFDDLKDALTMAEPWLTRQQTLW